MHLPLRSLFVALICSLFSIITISFPISAESTTTSGTVVETMNASDYTYLQVATDAETVWVAIPATVVSVGEKVQFEDGMVMTNFHSKILDKTFESIIFSPGLQGQASTSPQKVVEKKTASTTFSEAVKKESQTVAQDQPQAAVSAGSAGATVPYMDTKVEKASGENGYTIGEIFRQAESLSGKKVRVRGKVVKVSPNIMGRNWIHIQDGTGDPMQNSHDLVITSGEMAKVDDIIVAEGILAAKKDFGFGYKYEALIEQAAISK